MKKRTVLMLTAISTAALHALLVLAVYLQVERDWRSGMNWMGVAILDMLGLAALGEPEWIHESNQNTALWFLLVGTIQWCVLGLLLGWSWFLFLGVFSNGRAESS